MPQVSREYQDPIDNVIYDSSNHAVSIFKKLNFCYSYYMQNIIGHVYFYFWHIILIVLMDYLHVHINKHLNLVKCMIIIAI